MYVCLLNNFIKVIAGKIISVFYVAREVVH